MNPTPFEIGVATVMVVVSIALVVSALRYMAAGSEARMTRMLARAGVGPEVAGSAGNEAILRDVRSRCRSCASEDFCNRWLAGKVEGGNGFCPNAPVFRSLTGSAGRVAG